MLEKWLARKIDFLTLTVVAIFLCATSYFFIGRAAFFTNDAPFFNDIQFFLWAGALTIIDIGVFVYSKKFYQIKNNRWIAIFCLFFFLTAFAAVIGFNGVKYGEETIAFINGTNKFRYIFLSFLLFTSIYIIVVIIPKLVAEIKMLKLIFYLGVITAVAAVLYSFIFERQIYWDFFTGNINYETFEIPIPQSFTAHRNIYGYILFIGMVSEGYLEIEKPHWRRILIMLLFLIQQFLTFSKTPMILGWAFIAFIYVFSILISIKKKNYKHLIYLGVFGLVILVLSLTFFFADFSNTPLSNLTVFANFLKENLFNMFHNSLQSREISWTLPVSAISDNGVFSLIFGFGYGNEYHALGAYAYGDSLNFPIIDNAWGLMLAQNGIFGMAYGLLFWGFGLYLIFNSFRRRSVYCLFYLALYLCFFGRTFTENDTLSYLDLSGTVYFCFLYLPILIEECLDPKSLVYRKEAK